MIESVASIAPRSPPLTGASSIAIPRAANASAIVRVAPGSIELMSMTSDPGAAPSSTPPRSRKDQLDVGRVGQHRDRDVARGRDRRPDPTRASLPRRPARRRVRDCASGPSASKPAASRFRAMGLPMMPRPMKPIAIARTDAQPSIAASAIASERSMISNPSPSCSSVMHSGGFVITFHQRMNVDEPVVDQGPVELLHRVVHRVERRQRLHRLAVLDELDDAEQPDVPRAADAGVRRGKRLVVRAHHRVEALGVPDQVVVLEHVDRGDRGGDAEGMRVVGEPAPEHVARRSTPRSCGASPTAPSGAYDDVSPLAVVMRSGTTFQWSTANHSPVRPQPHITSSAIIWMPNRVQSSRTPCRYPSGGIRMPFVPVDRLQDEGGDRLRSLQLDRLLEQFERGLGVVEPALRAVVGVEHVHDARHRRASFGQRRGSPVSDIVRVRRPVVAAVASEHLLPSGDGLGHLHGVLVGLGARRG